MYRYTSQDASTRSMNKVTEPKAVNIKSPSRLIPNVLSNGKPRNYEGRNQSPYYNGCKKTKNKLSWGGSTKEKIDTTAANILTYPVKISNESYVMKLENGTCFLAKESSSRNYITVGYVINKNHQLSFKPHKRFFLSSLNDWSAFYTCLGKFLGDSPYWSILQQFRADLQLSLVKLKEVQQQRLDVRKQVLNNQVSSLQANESLYHLDKQISTLSVRITELQATLALYGSSPSITHKQCDIQKHLHLSSQHVSRSTNRANTQTLLGNSRLGKKERQALLRAKDATFQ